MVVAEAGPVAAPPVRQRCRLPPLRPLTEHEQQLVAANLGLAHMVAWKVANAVVWAEGAVARGAQRRAQQAVRELEGAAYEGLCIAAQRYDPALGWKFSTYAYEWIRQRCATEELYLRRGAKHHRRPSYRVRLLSEFFDPALWSERELDLAASLDCWDDRDPHPEATGKAHQLPLAPEAEAWLRRLLHADDLYVLRLHVLGSRTMTTVGRRLGVSRERIRQRMVRILRRLREYPELIECLFECVADKRTPPKRPPHGTAPERLA